MPFHHFVDKELIDETDKRIHETNKKIEGLEEHRFIANCLQIGFNINKSLALYSVNKIDFSNLTHFNPILSNTASAKHTAKRHDHTDSLRGARAITAGQAAPLDTRL